MKITNKNDHSQIQSILQNIKPGNYTIQQFTKGNTNTVYKCTLNNDKYILRIFGSDGIINRKREKLNILLLSQENINLAPKIKVLFENGIVSEFIEGNEISDSEMKSESKKVALKMKHWHNLSFKYENIIRYTLNENNGVKRTNCDLANDKFNGLANENNKMEYNYINESFKGLEDEIMNYKNKLPILVPTLNGWYRMALVKHKNLLEDLNIKFYIDDIKERSKKCKIGFCHNDLLSSNIIKNEEEIYFIDYEYAGFNYVGFDIANHLAEYAGYDLKFEEIPDNEGIIEFLKEYQDVELYEDVIYFLPVSHLFWGLWALLREGNFDYYGYGKKRIEEFLRTYKL